MNAATDLTVTSTSDETTDQLGRRMSSALVAGDLVTLSGPLGVGKSHLSRAIIRAMLCDPLAQVPSPSYTLVNVYQAGKLEIWHADLYRLGDASELTEIGLEDAVDHALVLIEWPERWANLPTRRLDLTLTFEPNDARSIKARTHGGGWDEVLHVLRASA
ncbi:MAG: tRNA (adenosine(37)-N6)-threonylcarbamoyltransferase complex ATPase subunit type 1 TsaE [Pseudomonadota bacterium]